VEDIFHQTRRWVYQAVILLSINGGFVNAVTFVSFFKNPVGYVTGTITFAASYLTHGDMANFVSMLLAILAFLIGAIISGVIIPYNNFNRNNKYNWVFTIEAMLLFCGMLGLLHDIEFSKYLLAMALGMQNASTTFYGMSMLRTTHMTGTMTDLGLTIAHKLIKRHDIPRWKFYVYLLLILGFFTGSVMGIVCFDYFGYYSLVISVVICLIMLSTLHF